MANTFPVMGGRVSRWLRGEVGRSYLVCLWHGVEVFGRVGEQSTRSADLLVMGSLVGDEIFPSVQCCFEKFGRYPTSDHLDVLLQPELELEIALLHHPSVKRPPQMMI